MHHVTQSLASGTKSICDSLPYPECNTHDRSLVTNSLYPFNKGNSSMLNGKLSMSSCTNCTNSVYLPSAISCNSHRVITIPALQELLMRKDLPS
ncbi:hypothetical protein Plhal304r1_c011g0044111 [Plasmopara halstedii]